MCLPLDSEKKKSVGFLVIGYWILSTVSGGYRLHWAAFVLA